MTLYTIIVPLVLTFIIYRASSSDQGRRYVHPRDIVHLLSPSNKPIDYLLRSRAIPNKRLLRTFQLGNTFVSDAVDIHTSFVSQAKHLIRAATAHGFPYWQEASSRAVHRCLSDNDNDAVAFHKFVQVVTMLAVVSGLLDPEADIENIAIRDAIIIGEEITELWRISKTGAQLDASRLADLNQHLRSLLPDADTFPNPLDFVIPTWETLWRVVAASLAQIVNCNADSQNVRSIFEAFHNQPTVEQFHKRDSALGFSAADFITETLRLSPPTKHIRRAQSDSFSWNIAQHLLKKLGFASRMPTLYVADIETAQRLHSIWGPDADVFNPRRHRTVSQDDDRRLLAFGVGHLKCVAASWAPVAAGGIVAAIMVNIKHAGFEIVPGPRMGTREGWDGWKVQRV